jgi:hypothetical protein
MSLSAPQIAPLTAPGLEVSVASGSQRSSVKLGPSSRAVFHVNRKQSVQIGNRTSSWKGITNDEAYSVSSLPLCGK